MQKKRFIMAVALSLCVLVLSGCGMRNLPVGDYIKSSTSPDNTYRINAYLCNGGATTDFSVRCEVETISSGEKRNIYWQYHQQDVEITWLNNQVVDIEGIELDVTKDSYDWRNENGEEKNNKQSLTENKDKTKVIIKR